MIILDMDMPKCCSDCDLYYDMVTCSVYGVDRDDDWYDIMEKKRMDSCPIIAEIPDNLTNGDVIKALFPHYDIEIDEHKNYIRVFYDNFYTTYPWKWWNAPYKAESEEQKI